MFKRGPLKSMEPISTYNNNDEDGISFNFSLEETDGKQSLSSQTNNEVYFDKSNFVNEFSQKYEIIELLGKGRFGIVYLVQQASDDSKSENIP